MRTLALLFVTACASTDPRLDARVHQLEAEVAAMRAAPAPARAHDGACAATEDVTVPRETMFDAVVPVHASQTSLRDGDSIVIDEVRGTSPSLAVNGLYRVSGHYTLASADEASLSFTVRATRPGDGCTRNDRDGHMRVRRGSGTFALTGRIAYEGEPSVSLFRVHDGVTTRADEIGVVYLGHVRDAK